MPSARPLPVGLSEAAAIWATDAWRSFADGADHSSLPLRIHSLQNQHRS